jgi:membrane protease YdiL (CAAX protease family)
MNHLLSILGLLPKNQYSLYLPLIALAIWVVFLPFAYIKRIRIFYDACIKVSFTEEILFRSIIFGACVYLGLSEIMTLIITSLLFGIFHMRNIWWAGWKRSWSMSVYAGVVGGPVFALARIITGDIYLGILLHFVHNFLIVFAPPGIRKYVDKTPTDAELQIAQQRR